MTALLTYKEKLKAISKMIVEAQRPVRVLDAIKFPPHLIQEFKKGKLKELPKFGADDYAKQSLGYDPDLKQQEFKDIAENARRELGADDALGGLLRDIANQYADVVEMLKHRGTQRFGELSKELYGSSKDRFYGGEETISELGQTLYGILSKFENIPLGPEQKEDITAEEAVEDLNRKLGKHFGPNEVEVILSDGIIADASAGGDTIKIRKESMFTKRDIEILEVHEGWVHVGTTLNGKAQHVAQWLSRGPPRVAAAQEGLAVIMEIFTFRSHVKRAKQINDRILGIEKSEEGANALELLEFYRTEGYSEEDCLYNMIRVLRGGVLAGGSPFTKDLSYCRGFIQNYNFMRTAIRQGKPQILPFLFVGKISLEDIPLLYEKHLEGVIDAPKFLPRQFRDLNGLAVWLSFSNFLNKVNLNSVQNHFEKLFQRHL